MYTSNSIRKENKRALNMKLPCNWFRRSRGRVTPSWQAEDSKPPARHCGGSRVWRRQWRILTRGVTSKVRTWKSMAVSSLPIAIDHPTYETPHPFAGYRNGPANRGEHCRSPGEKPRPEFLRGAGVGVPGVFVVLTRRGRDRGHADKMGKVRYCIVGVCGTSSWRGVHSVNSVNSAKSACPAQAICIVICKVMK